MNFIQKLSISRNLFILAAFILPVIAIAQTNAKADLDNLAKHYQSSNSLRADLTLEISYPEQPVEVQKGSIAQSGDKFHLKFDQQEVISDGKTTWMFFPENNEVHVYDAEEGAAEGGLMRPQDLLNIYNNDDFVYDIIGQIQEGTTSLNQIEFKPKDRDSEMSKIRLTYNPKTQEIKRLRVFNKDGSRFGLILSQVKLGQSIADNTFKFDENMHPNVMVEDMRL